MAVAAAVGTPAKTEAEGRVESLSFDRVFLT